MKKQKVATVKKGTAGRPEKYTIDFCLKEIEEFWEVLKDDASTDDELGKITWHDLVKDKPYSRQRISEWREKFKDDEIFSDTMKKIEDELENRLFKLGLKSKANPTLVIFGLKNNYGWKDKTETVYSGIPTTLNVTVDKSETAETLKKLRDGIG